MKFILIVISLTICTSVVYSQDLQADSLAILKREILALRSDVDNIQLNLGKSERKFKVGMVVATIGYSVTIAGGLMLGRENDDLGKVLLVSGGATGITGTFLLVDSFKYLGRASRRKVAH